jgi:hypothetical protein
MNATLPRAVFASQSRAFVLLQCAATMLLLSGTLIDRNAFSEDFRSGKPPNLFAAEIARYPDLFRVEQTLNRLPFQRFHPIQSVGWLEDGKRLAIADRAGITVWDVGTERLVSSLPSRVANSQFVTTLFGDRVFLRHGKLGGVLMSWPNQRVVQEFAPSKQADDGGRWRRCTSSCWPWSSPLAVDGRPIFGHMLSEVDKPSLSANLRYP